MTCQLLGSFAVVIQVLLGALALSSLLLKRYKEYPQRPWLIWFFDVSKQAFGAGMIHSLNLLISIVFGENENGPSEDPCVFYFLNVVVDCTLGVVILYVFLHLIERFVDYYGVTEMTTGVYGNPPRIRTWMKQSIGFFCALTSMKFAVVIILAIFPFLSDVAAWFLSPFSGNWRVAIVVLIVPLLMNIVQFWLVDGVIKSKDVKAIREDDAELSTSVLTETQIE